MRLFEMTESELDSAIQAHYNNLYDAYCDQQEGEPEPCCENCKYYDSGCCELLENEMPEEEITRMIEEGDYSAIEKDADDCCDDFDFERD